MTASVTRRLPSTLTPPLKPLPLSRPPSQPLPKPPIHLPHRNPHIHQPPHSNPPLPLPALQSPPPTLLPPLPLPITLSRSLPNIRQLLLHPSQYRFQLIVPNQPRVLPELIRQLQSLQTEREVGGVDVGGSEEGGGGGFDGVGFVSGEVDCV